VPAERLPVVIFVTAHDDYAVRAFEVCAVDYVLKPFAEDRLRAAVARAKALLATDLGALRTTLHALAEELLHETPRIETHLVRGSDRPGGFGEHPVPAVAPAVANAVFQATGRRVRRLPITPAALRDTPSVHSGLA
jgi:DNA-binding LytR/AlgR family response regulator